MERLRQVILAGAVLAAVGGCAATDRLSSGYLDARRAVGLEPAPARPVTQVSLLFEKRLQSLPDPTRPDATQAGLPGQLFVTAAEGQPTVVAGPVTITVYDKTPRPAGQPPRTPEKWEFTPDVLARLRTDKGQLGACYVVFLPWPKGWEDVTRVSIRGLYKADGGPELFSHEAQVALEAGDQSAAPGWVKAENYAVPVVQGAKPGDAPPAAFKLPPPPVELPPGFQPQPNPGAVLPPPAINPPTGPQTIVLPRS